MTEHDPAHDELVSAHLDGESTPEEAERIARDPALQARLEAFASVRDAVRDEVPALGDAERDALLARVLGASMAPTNVVAMSTRRRVGSRVLGVAAAFLAIAFLGAALVLADHDGGGGDDDSSAALEASQDAATTLSANEELSTSGADGSGGAGNPTGSEAYTAAAEPITLPGTFTDADGLVSRVRAEAAPPADTDEQEAPDTGDSSATTDDPVTPETTRAASGVAACEQRGTDATYSADLAGRPVLVVVDADTITVVDAVDCTRITTAPRG